MSERITAGLAGPAVVPPWPASGTHRPRLRERGAGILALTWTWHYALHGSPTLGGHCVLDPEHG